MIKLQFFIALLVAAVDAIWQQAKGIWVAMFSKKARVSEALKSERLSVCRECSVRFSLLNTCGSPLRKHRGLGIRPGCNCWLPLAASTHHDCWLYEFNREGGWPKELNSSYILSNEQREP